jgi:methionyl-tRNA formyltransferase
VLQASATSGALPPSELHAEGDHLFAGCGSDTALELLEVQLEGKKRTPAADFIRGYRPLPEEKLGS